MTKTITASPNPAAENDVVTVSITDGPPGGQVTVTVKNGETGPSEVVTVDIGVNGDGSAPWTVPVGWAAIGLAVFSAPNAVGDTIQINEQASAASATAPSS